MIYLEAIQEHVAALQYALSQDNVTERDYHIGVIREYLEAWPILNPYDGPCPICGKDGRCEPIGGLLVDEPLTMVDWTEIYTFETKCRQPFYHRVIERARHRA